MAYFEDDCFCEGHYFIQFKNKLLHELSEYIFINDVHKSAQVVGYKHEARFSPFFVIT